MSEIAFNVIAGGDIQLVQGRKNAVKLAKDMSRESHQQVTVEREDGMELMQFADGSLYSLVCETRGRRKPTIAEQQRSGSDGASEGGTPPAAEAASADAEAAPAAEAASPDAEAAAPAAEAASADAEAAPAAEAAAPAAEEASADAEPTAPSTETAASNETSADDDAAPVPAET